MSVSTWRRLNARRDHRWARTRLPAFVDNELPSRQQRRLAQHEELCPDCRRVVRTLGALSLVLPSLRLAPQAALDVAERTLARVQARIQEWS